LRRRDEEKCDKQIAMRHGALIVLKGGHFWKG
jgi:hypothetical protein